MISITLVTMIALAAAAPSAAPSGQARKAYSTCIQKVIKAKTADKLSAEAFTSEVKTACANEEAAFRKSLIDYDLASGAKRADAEEGATLQVEDYLLNASDTYATYTTPK